jgi:hypothetical protein
VYVLVDKLILVKEKIYSCCFLLDFIGARMLGEECEINDECRRTPVDGTKICLSNQCQCSSGHVPIDAYRCIRDFGLFI